MREATYHTLRLLLITNLIYQIGLAGFAYGAFTSHIVYGHECQVTRLSDVDLLIAYVRTGSQTKNLKSMLSYSKQK